MLNFSPEVICPSRFLLPCHTWFMMAFLNGWLEPFWICLGACQQGLASKSVQGMSLAFESVNHTHNSWHYHEEFACSRRCQLLNCSLIVFCRVHQESVGHCFWQTCWLLKEPLLLLFFSVHETRSLAAGILGHDLRTLADGVFCKFTGNQKSYCCLDLSLTNGGILVVK